MSRSYRKYKGLNHTWSDTKQGKATKKISHRQIRAKAKASEDGVELAKKCARGNRYDGKSVSESDFEYMASIMMPKLARAAQENKLKPAEIHPAKDYRFFDLNAMKSEVYFYLIKKIISLETNKIAYEGIMVDLNAKTVICDGKELEFTKLEFELLSFFLQHPNKVFSREDLLKYCWPQDVLVLDRTVDVNITRLRKKIGHYGKQIKTRVGYGYCFEK